MINGNMTYIIIVARDVSHTRCKLIYLSDISDYLASKYMMFSLHQLKWPIQFIINILPNGSGYKVSGKSFYSPLITLFNL
jgi:hypothetical protein